MSWLRGGTAAGSVQGLCPACLLKRGLETQTAVGAGSGPSAAADVPPPTPEELAPYFPELEILELVGRGGMGVVYKARQKSLDRLVALKILSPSIALDPAFAERFTREARAMAKLSHPHIVAIHEFGQKPLAPAPAGPGAGAVFYFLMEFVDGASLRRLLDAGKLAPRRPWRSCRRSAMPSNTPTMPASCIATSSRRTSSWTSRAG